MRVYFDYIWAFFMRAPLPTDVPVLLLNPARRMRRNDTGTTKSTPPPPPLQEQTKNKEKQKQKEYNNIKHTLEECLIIYEPVDVFSVRNNKLGWSRFHQSGLTEQIRLRTERIFWVFVVHASCMRKRFGQNLG